MSKHVDNDGITITFTNSSLDEAIDTLTLNTLDVDNTDTPSIKRLKVDNNGVYVNASSTTWTDTLTTTTLPFTITVNDANALLVEDELNAELLNANTDTMTVSLNGTVAQITETDVNVTAPITVTTTDTSALLVEDAVNTTLLNGDTTNMVVTTGGPLRVPNGSAAAPSISRAGDTDCGFYADALGHFKFASGGTEIFEMDEDGVKMSSAGSYISLQAGSAVAPPIRFDSDTGIYGVSNTSVNVTVNGTTMGTFDADGLSLGSTDQLSITGNAGSAAAPQIKFGTNCGLYSNAADVVAVTCAGSTKLYVTSSQVEVQDKMFIDDTDTEAFLVRKNGDTQDVFTVDTSTPKIICGTNVTIPDDGTVYNTGNDGLKVSNTSGYAALVENSTEVVKASASTLTCKSNAFVFQPVSSATTNITYDFMQGDGASNFVSLLSVSETNIVAAVDLQLPSGGGQLGYYSTGTHNTTWSGIWASPVTGNIKYVRIGQTITLTIPSVQATANAASTITNTTALPTALRPVTGATVALITYQNGVAGQGFMKINTSGTFTVYASAALGNFSGVGTSGFDIITLSYTI